MQLAGYDQLSTLRTERTYDLYRARDVADDRWVMLKVFRFTLDDDHGEQLFRENCARAVELSAHPQVADLYDVGLTDNRHPYLVMELVEGATVAHRLTQRPSGTLEPDEAVAIGVVVADALQAAHESGAVHGLLSPDSIMLTGDGQPRLTDLGVGLLEQRWEATGHRADVVPYHAAPEVIERGTPGPASDVYSLASTVYTMVAGHAPHEVGSVDSVSALLLRILQGTVPRLPADAPPQLDQALQQALAASPEERTASAGEFARQLGGALSPAGNGQEPQDQLNDQDQQNDLHQQDDRHDHVAPLLLSEPPSDPGPQPADQADTALPPPEPARNPWDSPPTLEPEPALPEPDPDQIAATMPDPVPAPPPPPPTGEEGPEVEAPATGLAAQLARLDSTTTTDLPVEVDFATDLDDVRETETSDGVAAPAAWEAGRVPAPLDRPLPADQFDPVDPVDDEPTVGELAVVPSGPPVLGDDHADEGNEGSLVPVPQEADEQGQGSNRSALLVLGGLVVLAVCALVAVVVLGGGDDDGTAQDEIAGREEITPTGDDTNEEAGTREPEADEELPDEEDDGGTETDAADEDVDDVGDEATGPEDDAETTDSEASGLPVPTDLQVGVNNDGVQVSWEPGGDDDYAGPFLLLMLSEQDRPRTQSVDGTSVLLPVDLSDDNGYCFGVARADVAAEVAPGEGERVGDYEVGAAFGEMSCIRGATEETVRTE